MLRRILIFIVPLFFSCYTWAQIQIEWTAMVGVNYDEATGSLTKTETDGWNNAGARSLNRLDENEDGIIKYIINNLSTEKAIGLSTKNNDQKIKSLDYALVFNGNKLSIYEAGKFKGQFGKIKIGDEVSIEREGNKIVFRKNRKQIKELNTNSTHQLYADIAIFTQGGSISGLTASFNKPLEINFTKQDATCIEGSSGLIDVTTTGGTPPYSYSWSNGATTEDISSLDIGEYTLIVTDANAKTKKQKVNILSEVVWKKLDGLTYVNGVITKLGLTGWSTGEAISYNRLLSNTDGFVEYQIDEINTTKILALTTESNIEGLNGLKYSLFIYNNNLFIFEDGIYKGYFGKIRIGDQLTIKREGTRIEYRNNKKLLKKTTVDQTQELVIKLALYTQGATFNNLKSNFCNVPFFVDFTVTLVTQNVLGAITLNPQFGTLPYTYLWDDGNTTKDRDNLESGIYYVTITDALAQIIQLKVVVGMELEFANTTGITINNNEELIKTAPDGFGNAMTTLNNLVEGDGEVRVEITDPKKEFTFGFRAENETQATDYTGLSFGLYIDSLGNLNSWNKITQTLTNLGVLVSEDIISIQKEGQNLFYKKNDTVIGKDFIALAFDTIIKDTTVNDTSKQTPGRILSINDTTSTTTILSLTDGTESTYTDSLPTLAVEGSTVSYTKDTTTNTVSDVKFPVATALADPRLCDTKKGEVPLFKIDFSLGSDKVRLAQIKVIKFSVLPKITATINHAICSIPNSGGILSMVKGGVPPYTYNWTSTNGFSASTADITGINPGIYTLTVTDSWTTPHVVSENYEVGYDALVTNLSGCRNTNPIDSTESPSKNNTSLSRSELCAAYATKGTAESMNQLNPNENGGITYIIDQIGYTKTFGMSERDNSQPADTIDYSIQLRSGVDINIFEQGTYIGPFGKVKMGDVVKIERFEGQVLYKNNGVVLRTVGTDASKKLIAKFVLDETCASFNNLYTNFCNLRLSADFTTTNQSTSDFGSIVIEPKYGVAPYYYFWEDGDHSKARYNLESGVYKIFIVDTIQDTTKIEAIVFADLEFSNEYNVVINGNIISNGVSGTGLLTLNNAVEGDGEITVRLGPLNADSRSNSQSFTFGFRKTNSNQATGFDQMDYAIYVNPFGNVFSFDQTGLIDLGVVAKSGDILNIEKSGNQVIYKMNGNSLRQVDDLTQNTYRTDFVLFTSLMKLVAVGAIKWKFWPNPTAIITHKTSCFSVANNDGAIDLSVSGGYPPFAYQWSNGATTQDISGLVPGVYTVVVTDSWPFLPGPHIVTRTYSVGVDLAWQNLQNATAPSTTIVKNSSAPSGWGTGGGSSQNILYDYSDGWVEFNVPTFVNDLNYVAIGLSDDDNNTHINDIDYGLSFFTIDVVFPSLQYQYHVFWVTQNGIPLSPLMPYQTNDKFKIQFLQATNDILYYKNNLVVHTSSSVPAPINGSFVVDAAIFTPGGTIENVAVSFGCKQPFIYGHLRKKLDGGVYRVVNDKVYLKYQEEYNSSNFKFNIYDDNNLLFANQSNLSLTTFNGYGDNRIEIGLLGSGVTFPLGYYILEVINDKNEKWYLRFKY